MSEGVVIKFPGDYMGPIQEADEVQTRVCSNCAHAALHNSGVYCVEFTEFVVSESVAEECGEYTT